MRQPGPDESSGEALLIEPCGLVFADSRRQDFSFPRARGCFKAFQLSQYSTNSNRALHASFGCYTLPLEEETEEIACFDGLDFSAQALDCVSMDSREQAA